MIIGKFLFILIGNDKTGKTTLQKKLVDKLCWHKYSRLPTNRAFEVKHPDIKNKYKEISFGSRSYQEKTREYKSVENYFTKYFYPADIAFLSSHLNARDIDQMIEEGKKRYYNVYGIFWSNSIADDEETNSQIALLPWNEIFYIGNPNRKNKKDIEHQLDLIADSIVQLLERRTSIS